MIVKLSFTYTGEVGAVTIAWFRAGAIPVVDGTYSGVTISGSTTTTLTIADTTEDWYGGYYATVTDSQGCVTQTAMFTVGCTLEITSQPTGGIVAEGSSISLTFTYTGGVGPFGVQWYQDGNPVTDGVSADGATISGATTTTLSITDMGCLESGVYTAVVTDLGFPNCSVTTDPVTVQTPCPEAYYYNFEGIVTDALGFSVFENLPDPCPYFNQRVFTTQPGDIQAGIIGNAVLYGVDHTLASGTLTLTAPFSGCLNLYDRSWTIRFWRKFVPGDGGGQQDSLNRGLFVDDGTAFGVLGIGCGTTDAINYYYGAEIDAETGPPVITGVAVTGGTATLNDWHRVVFSYDHIAKVLHMKVNNDAYTDLTMAADFFVKNIPRSIYLGITEGFSLWDELAVLPDVVWDEAAATYDWNGGAGRTWPDLPP